MFSEGVVVVVVVVSGNMIFFPQRKKAVCTVQLSLGANPIKEI